MKAAVQIKKTYFSDEELTLLDFSRIPKHIAIIMDGNRRWAKMRGLNPIQGHWQGADTLTETVRAAAELGIETITAFAFSTENWLRTKQEIDGLMYLFEAYLIRQKKKMYEEGIRLHVIGNLESLSPSLLKVLEETENYTQNCHRIDLVLALNYGGRDAIRRAFCDMLDDFEKGKVRKEEISETLISHYLDSHGFKDPDILIRASGEMRISNFLLWEIAYSEIVVQDVLWPNFTEKNLLNAVLEYQSRERRGGT